MGLSWQQGPLGRTPNGAFLTTTPMPERVLYAEPLCRRMSVELAGSVVARTGDAVLLFEPGRYPGAYFPTGDIAAGVKMTVTLDGERAESPAPGQTVVAHGPDRNLAVDEIGGVQLVEGAAVAAGHGPS